MKKCQNGGWQVCGDNMHNSFRNTALKEFGIVLLDTPEHMVFVFEAEFNVLNFLHQLEKDFILSYERIYTTLLLNMMEVKEKP